MKELIKEWIDHVTLGMEVIGVLIIVGGSLYMFIRYIPHLKDPETFKTLRQQLGKVILLGLEVLVSADIIGTVTADVTMQRVLILGVIVLIRTFMSLSIKIEIEGKVPWK